MNLREMGKTTFPPIVVSNEIPKNGKGEDGGRKGLGLGAGRIDEGFNFVLIKFEMSKRVVSRVL